MQAALSGWPEREVLALAKPEGQGPRQRVMPVQRPWGPRDVCVSTGRLPLGSRVKVRGGVIGLGLQLPAGCRPQGDSRRSQGSGETSMEGLPWPQARDRWQARLCWQCGGAERWGRVWRWRQIGWRHALGPSVLGRWLQQSAEAFLTVLGFCGRRGGLGPSGYRVCKWRPQYREWRLSWAKILAVLEVRFPGRQPWPPPGSC